MMVGYHPEMILAGRRINDSMGSYIADQVSKLMIKQDINIANANVLIMGLAFKENCPDLRNSGVVEMVNVFKDFSCNVDVYDPRVDAEEAKKEYGIDLIKKLENDKYDAIVIAVAHDEFKALPIETIRALGKPNNLLYDVKYLFEQSHVDGRL